MKKFLLIPVIVFWSCASPRVPPIDVFTPTKKTNPEALVATPLSEGLMNDHDVWEFLKNNPPEKKVLSTLGLPDSVWVDENYEFKVLYYYIQDIQDYNSVEIDLKTGLATGFEWD